MIFYAQRKRGFGHREVQAPGESTYYRVLSYDIARLERAARLRAKLKPAMKSRDPEHLNRKARERAASKAGRGTCTRCGKPWSGGTHNCRACMRENAETRMLNEAGNRARGLCGACGAPPTPGYRTCSACRHASSHSRHERNRDRQQREWRAAGLCSRCGSKAAPNRTRCRPCALLVASQKRVQRAAKKLLDNRRRSV